MTREEFEALICDRYGITADYPLEDDLSTAVFRHMRNRKWFAVVMNIKRQRIGLEGDGNIDVVNLKCDPEVIYSLADQEAGLYRAYHMNKTHWITAALDGTCADGTLEWLLGISHSLTAPKIKPQKKKNAD